MLKLYYAPDNASLVLRLALEEAGLAYETVLVDRATGAQKSAYYLAINPAGLIPALETPQGILAETGACLLWLSDAYPAAQLGPSLQDAHRGKFLRWLFYLSNTVHADLRRLFYAHRYVPADAVAVHHDMMAQHVQRHFGVLDAAAARDPELFAPPSALALYLAPMLRWSALYPKSATRWFDLRSYPALESAAASLQERPSAKVAAEAEGLGPEPFTNPQYPQPPEGSAI